MNLRASVKVILRARPAWLEAAIEALVARYPDLGLFDPQGFGSAHGAWLVMSRIHARVLEQLLDHPQQGLRVTAATQLAKYRDAPTRVWDVLEEGAKSFQGSADGRRCCGRAC